MEGWASKKIGEVCELMTGGTPSRAKPEYFDGGSIKWLVSGDIHQKEIKDCSGRITELGLEKSNAKYLPINSVMIALNGQGKTRGTVALLRTRATCNQSMVSIYPKDPKRLLPEYIYANLHARYEEIRRITGDDGNDRRGLNMTLVRNIEIPIAPIEEQERIVAILDEAIAAIATATANAEKNLANARELFESYVDLAFQRSGDRWNSGALSTFVADIATGPFGSLLHRSDYVEDGIPLINPINIVGDSIVPDPRKSVGPETRKRLSKYTVDEGDIVIARRGEIGRCVAVGRDEAGWLCGTGCFVIKPAEQVNSRFLTHLLRSSVYRKRLERVSDRATMPSLSNKDLAHLDVTIPELDEQYELLDRFDYLSSESRRLADVSERRADLLAELKQSILHKAFAGELTSVPNAADRKLSEAGL